MKILVVEPGKKPKPQEIDDSLKAMQKQVGGLIQALYPFEDHVALICNDEAKLLNLPMNRALRDDNGSVYDIVYGTFFLCSAPPDGDSFESLTRDQVEYFTKFFAMPEIFLSVNGRLMILRIK